MAIDGNLESRRTPNVFHSNATGGWWQVELANPTDVTKVHIFQITDCCQGRLASGYKVQYLDEKGAVLYTSSNLTGEQEQVIPNGVVHQFSRNGVTMGLNDNAQTFDNLYVNKGGCCGGETSDGQIAEILMWNIGLNDTEHNIVVGYLANKWGMHS
jgi:hypothetical protein